MQSSHFYPSLLREQSPVTGDGRNKKLLIVLKFCKVNQYTLILFFKKTLKKLTPLRSTSRIEGAIKLLYAAKSSKSTLNSRLKSPLENYCIKMYLAIAVNCNKEQHEYKTNPKTLQSTGKGGRINGKVTQKRRSTYSGRKKTKKSPFSRKSPVSNPISKALMRTILLLCSKFCLSPMEIDRLLVKFKFEMCWH